MTRGGVPKDRVLTSRDLKTFDREVAEYILWLTTEKNVKTRMPDGMHVLLYPPDGTTRPFKVSRSRPAKASMNYLRKFARDNHLEDQ